MEGTEVINEQPAPKPPRKPRPSEIAAKKAKAAKKKKPAKKAKMKAKTKKKRFKKQGPLHQHSRTSKKAKSSKKTSGVVRCERVDMRVSKAEKARIVAKAKKLRRTVTSVVLEAIEKIK